MLLFRQKRETVFMVSLKLLIFVAGGPEASSQRFEATEKVLDFIFWLNTAVDFRKWLRFPRGDLDPPRAAPCGVSTLSLLPRRSLRHLLQSTTRNREALYEISFSVASFVAGASLSLPPAGVFAPSTTINYSFKYSLLFFYA
ncbi:hypothetical protein [Sutcliffiella horikoshii]|uniref:hypothetical protein n=1 Tax=Sutcliffiella horikoshii TaxID=79883 RepID=UPI00384CC943